MDEKPKGPIKNNRGNKEQQRIRAIKAFQLRMANYTFEDIAQELGFAGPGSAKKAVQRIIEKLEYDVTEDARKFEAAKINEVESAFWAKAIYPGKGFFSWKEQLEAAKLVLGAIKQRADMMGINVNPTAQAKLLVEGRFRVIWDTPRTLTEEQLQRLEQLSKPKELPSSTTSSDDNGEPQPPSKPTQ